MALLIGADKGILRLAAEPYDETIVDWIRTLPQRRYRHESHDWSIPARREHLQTVCSLIAELEERGIGVEISETASAHLARVDIGRAVLRDSAIEIAGPYSERRLPALRALPERRFDTERKLWTIPLTRAGALAILALADDTDELVVTQRAHRALQRSATPSPPAERVARNADASVAPTTRRSPVAHWRHYTAGAVFDNRAHPRVHVPGIGLCVRIRVKPRPPRSMNRGSTSLTRVEVVSPAPDAGGEQSAQFVEEQRSPPVLPLLVPCGRLGIPSSDQKARRPEGNSPGWRLVRTTIGPTAERRHPAAASAR